MSNKNALCISQFQLRPAPPRATAGHLPALSVPGVGHLQILCCPGAGNLPTPGPFPELLTRTRFPIRNNYTEDFIGKKGRLAHLSRTGKIEEVCKGMFLILCMHFLHCLSSENYIAKSGGIDVNQRFLVIESNFC